MRKLTFKVAHRAFTLTIMAGTIFLSSCHKEKIINLSEPLEVAPALSRSMNYDNGLYENTIDSFANLVDKEAPTTGDIIFLDSIYGMMNTSQLEYFLIKYKQVVINSLADDEVDEFYENETSTTNYLENLLANSEVIYNKSYNKLSIDERVYLTQQSASSSSNCPAVSFPNNVCVGSGVISCGSFYRVSTPDEPNDCDYEFCFNGGPVSTNYYTKVAGTSWAANQVINHWGTCGVKSRTNYSTYTNILIGNGAINWYFWGSGNKFKKKVKMGN